MTKETILIVDDEEDILEFVQYNLAREGLNVRCVTSGESALRDVQEKLPDLVILDLMLPVLDGLEVCKRLKADSKTRHIPIIMLTAKGDESDIVLGLEMGAEDYVTKPFSPRVLVARVRAALRRKQLAATSDGEALRIHDLEICPGRHEVRIEGDPIPLTYTEFGILHFLASRPGWVYSRHQIVEAVRGDEYAVTDRSVDVQIAGLRKKLGACSSYIETIRGVGYRFKE